MPPAAFDRARHCASNGHIIVDFGLSHHLIFVSPRLAGTISEVNNTQPTQQEEAGATIPE